MTPTALLKSAVIASLATLAWPAPPAHADPDPFTISIYLTTLNQTRVPYDNPGRMVDIGNTVCQQARDGVPFDTIGQNVASNGYAFVQAGYIMGAAVATFCPDMQPAMDRWSNG